MPSRVRSLRRSTSNSAKVARMLKEHLAHRVGGVVEGAAEGELYAAFDEGVADVPGVGHRAGEPVQFRDDESVMASLGVQNGRSMPNQWSALVSRTCVEPAMCNTCGGTRRVGD